MTTPVTIDQNGNVLPEDLSIPPALDRIQGRSKEEIDTERDRLIAENKVRSHHRYGHPIPEDSIPAFLTPDGVTTNTRGAK
jgi:hypothetical protein